VGLADSSQRGSRHFWSGPSHTWVINVKIQVAKHAKFHTTQHYLFISVVDFEENYSPIHCSSIKKINNCENGGKSIFNKLTEGNSECFYKTRIYQTIFIQISYSACQKNRFISGSNAECMCINIFDYLIYLNQIYIFPWDTADFGKKCWLQDKFLSH
jgi:hypothetical protein